MRGGFRTKIFLAIVTVAAAVVLLASALIAASLRRQTYERIERALVSEARLAAELLSHRAAVTAEAELQQEAQVVGRDSGARITLIDAGGRVVGDSSQTDASLAQLENHLDRPEVSGARQRGIGIETRSSATLDMNMLYVAAAVRHPSIAYVRLALPLTEIERQLRTIWQSALYALLFSVIGAFAMAWVSSAILVRRLNRLAEGARQYASGVIPAPPADYEDDEIGTVARVLDDAVRRLGDHAADLARDRARMAAILGGMVEGVLVVDADGRVQLVNAAAQRMLRLDRGFEGRHYLEGVRHPEVVAQLDAARTRRGPIAPSIVQEGGLVFVARAAPVSPQGEGAVLVVHDLTDLHRTDQVRRDFVANVSHELRTPLTSIRGYVEALCDDVVEPADRRRFLDIIMRQTTRMERLARDLLRLAQLEAGQEPPQYASCAVADLFAAVVADLRPAIEAKRQRVDVRVEAAAAVIAADPLQLHDAVRNLLDNAVLYSAEGGLITLDAAVDGGEIAISVIDEGPGIPAGDVDRVFERFYRVDKGRSRESGGTGLGLSIVKHLVERMDGTVKVANRAARGATFTIRLPNVRPTVTAGT
jgi:two-component system phosphate regulon sensor histidine kinase PhoR